MPKLETTTRVVNANGDTIILCGESCVYHPDKTYKVVPLMCNLDDLRDLRDACDIIIKRDWHKKGADHV